MMDKKNQLDKLFREAHEKGLFTGTWLFAEKGQIVSKGALGWRDPADTLPLEEDCIFDLASVSKQFTAAAVMLLRRRGLLALDDEITKFFPAIPYRGVTLRHLLQHTGGLPDYMNWVEKTALAENTIPDNDVIVRFLCECGEPPVFAPGEKWEYSNTGYCLLAQIVEEVSGVPFEDFMRDNVFEPAGLHRTRIYHRRKDRLSPEKLAYGMVLDLSSGQYRLPDDSPEADYVVPLDGVSGDGLVHSDIFDLLAWDRALREETVLTWEEQSLMVTPARLNNGEIAETDEDAEDGYGFGWGIEREESLGLIVSHSGGWPGYFSWFERFLDADMVLILLSCRDALDGKAADAFFEGMRSIVRGKEPEPIRTIEALALRDPDRSGWNAFLGRYDYAEEDFRIEEILMKDGELYAVVSLRGIRHECRLYPMAENTFGIKVFSSELSFGEDSLTFWGKTGKKL